MPPVDDEVLSVGHGWEGGLPVPCVALDPILSGLARSCSGCRPSAAACDHTLTGLGTVVY